MAERIAYIFVGGDISESVEKKIGTGRFDRRHDRNLKRMKETGDLATHHFCSSIERGTGRTKHQTWSLTTRKKPVVREFHWFHDRLIPVANREGGSHRRCSDKNIHFYRIQRLIFLEVEMIDFSPLNFVQIQFTLFYWRTIEWEEKDGYPPVVTTHTLHVRLILTPDHTNHRFNYSQAKLFFACLLNFNPSKPSNSCLITIIVLDSLVRQPNFVLDPGKPKKTCFVHFPKTSVCHS